MNRPTVKFNKEVPATHGRGFTLIEMIVSLGIFSIVAVVALGALVKIISANHKAQALQAAFTNINFALEAMSRELRVGTSYHCETGLNGLNWNSSGNGMKPTNCLVDGGRLIAFYSNRIASTGSGGTCRLFNAYRFNGSAGNWTLEKAEQTACNDVVNPSNAASYFKPMISPNISVTNYRLGVTGSLYPRVFIRLIGYAGDKEKTKTDFDVQTTISQRIPD